MKYLLGMIAIGIIVAGACCVIAGTTLFWGNVLHGFNWSFHVIFTTMFSFEVFAITSAIIFLLPWEKEYERMLEEGCGEEFSFYKACDNTTYCPPRWLLQYSRK